MGAFCIVLEFILFVFLDKGFLLFPICILSYDAIYLAVPLAAGQSPPLAGQAEFILLGSLLSRG